MFYVTAETILNLTDKYHRLHFMVKHFMQTVSLTGLWDLWGLASCGNRRGTCQKTTGSSFIHCALKRSRVGETRKGRSREVDLDAATAGRL